MWEAEILQNLCKSLQTKFWISFCCKDGIHLSDGSEVVEAVSLFKQIDGCIAVGVNCVHPKFVSSLIEEIKSTNIQVNKRIIVYANSGEIWNSDSSTWSADHTNEVDFLCYADRWAAQGVSMIGGCCRIFDTSIKDLHAKWKP